MNESYYTFAAFALLAFEYVITFDREERLVWGRKVSGATVLFLFNRYWLFFQYISQVITAFPLSQQVSRKCNVVGYMVIVGNAGPPFIWAAFSMLRGYALSGRRSWVALLIVTFFLPDIALTCVYYSTLVPTAAPPPFNCLLSSDLAESTWIHFSLLIYIPLSDVIASRACLIAGDLIVLLVTWYSTYGITRAAKVANIQMSLTSALLKDGTVYFVCLLILNILNIIFNAVPNSSAISAFQDPITSILVSRFLLNLRDVLTTGTHDTRPSYIRPSSHAGHVSTGVQFAEFVEPMGADLDHPFFAYDESDVSTKWSDTSDAMVDTELANLKTPLDTDPVIHLQEPRITGSMGELGEIQSPIEPPTGHGGLSKASRTR
ncbi:hypothetical protein BC628DRAFT_1317402 [Trametes gibbosa]|nr:hypothetical protein BC628DRAFT_1317402 [Trametes gibbosa]